MLLEAAARIGSAITLPEIPEKYKKYKVINRGTTSIILDKDEHNVFVLTRDDMKTDWFNHSAIAKYVEKFDGVGNTKFKELPIYVYEMPKLQPIGKGNIKKVNEVLKEFDRIRIPLLRQHSSKLMNALSEMAEEYELKFNKPHALADFISFIINYDESQYHFDLRRANFMQDDKGNIVVVDPVVSREIMDLVKSRHTMHSSEEPKGQAMSKVHNPLLDKRKGRQVNTEMNASDNNIMEGDGPISPVSNRRMQRAMCGSIPVWLDAQARLILPIKKGM